MILVSLAHVVVVKHMKQLLNSFPCQRAHPFGLAAQKIIEETQTVYSVDPIIIEARLS